MSSERLSRKVLDCYRVKRKTYHLMRAAAKLWAEGVPWANAYGIVSEAFNACLAETD